MRGDVIWLIRGLLGHARSGVLRQELPAATRRLYLLRGRAVAASSNRPGETLRDAFSARWRIPLAELRDESPDSDEASALRGAAVRFGVPAVEVDALVFEHVLCSGAEMLASGRGDFSFEEARLLAPPYVLEGPTLEQLFLAAAPRDPEFEWARPVLAGCPAALARAPGVRNLDVPSGLPFAAACKAAGGTEDAARRLWGLLLLGRLRLATAQTPEVKEPADDPAGAPEEEQIARRLMRRGVSNRAAEDAAYALRHEKPRG